MCFLTNGVHTNKISLFHGVLVHAIDRAQVMEIFFLEFSKLSIIHHILVHATDSVQMMELEIF